ncbi:MAG: hypothetical protein WBG86_14905, partial [Polyangiales bacterium]
AETCSDGAARRRAARLGPGEATLVEWMPTPNGPDGELEWVEVLLEARADLQGVRLGTDDDSLGPIVIKSCFPVDAGSRIVFGASPRAAPRVDADLGIALGNTGARSIIVALEDTILDRIDYLDAREGLAQQVDTNGDLCDVEAAADNEYMLQNFGSPGFANPSCPETLEPGMCLDQGTARAIRLPRPSDVRISEWMANPTQVENRDGEWVEVEFLRSADLNGLVWSDLSSEGAPLESTQCLPVDVGAHVLFARNLDASQNGGLPVNAHALGISLNNVNESIALSVGGETLDSVSYVSSRSGVATQRDDSDAICDAVTPYGAGDLGSPGQPNRVCP